MRENPLVPHTVPYRDSTIPYRTVSPYFFFSYTVSSRDETVRYGIGTAYRQSLIHTIFNPILEYVCAANIPNPEMQIRIKATPRLMSGLLVIVSFTDSYPTTAKGTL